MNAKPPFDAETTRQAVALLTQRHRRRLKPDEGFRITAHVEPPYVGVTLTLANADESMVYPMEARVPRETEGLDDDTACAELCLDFLDYYVGEYLRGGRDVYLTLDWSAVRFGEYEVQARGQVLNLKLERLADALLAEADARERGQ